MSGVIEQEAKIIFLDGVPIGLTENDFKKIYEAIAANCIDRLENIDPEDKVTGTRTIIEFATWLKYAIGSQQIKARREILEINRR